MTAPSSRGQERVVGRYVLCDEIAAGGMATVHVGRLLGPVGFARIVAIKRLHAHFAKDPEFVAMLLDEARLAARIQHPNVISTLDVVVEKGEMLVVMDYVQGESLARLARAVWAEGQRIPVGIIMAIMAGALYGLHAAHDATNDQGQPLGIVHRDVSPQNILVGVDGVARVLDFGVAKAVGRAQTTRDGTLKGKLAYMSPEQISGEAVDRRSDVFAASIVLWELLCGRRLFQADSEGAVVHKIMTGKVDPPSRVIPELSSKIDALVMKGLAADPRQRYQTAAAMAEAAQRVAFATPGDVSAWVKYYCGDALGERAAIIAEIESQPAKRVEGPASESEAPTTTYTGALSLEVVATLAQEARGRTLVDPRPPVGPAESQVTDLSAATPYRKGGAVGRPLVVALLAFVVASVVAVVFIGVLVARRGSSAASATEAAPIDTSIPASASATTLPSPSTPTLTSTSTPTLAPAKPPRPAIPVPPPRSKCNPPYTVDANGIRTPKPECL